ncbi:MAG: D-alanyl-D-alanine carboxypeptidase [Candidatus Staskawiczbacteria bacterium]|nr:D-alanyl-D-alanine carboxypeptidase [Candidatus Staskawiczbacteria bacterium]
MDYKFFFKNFFVFSISIMVFSWGVEWFFNGLTNYSEWKSGKSENILLASASDYNYYDKTESKEAASPDIEPPYRNWQANDVEINARAAISVESSLSDSGKILFKKNEREKLPIASLVKLMTAIISLENYDLSNKVKINVKTTMKEDERGELIKIDEMPVKDLLYLMLIESNNHAAYSLADLTGMEKFTDLMNKKAESIAKITSLKEFYLYQEDGIFYKKLFNTNKLISEIPETVAGKTGFIEEAKGCLLLVVKNPKNNSYLISVVLGADDRFAEMKKIVDWVRLAYIWE